MIKAGIAGGDTTAGGEVIKLLVNHPDVEIMWVQAPEQYAGQLLHTVHRSLRGESYMRFSAKAPSTDEQPVDVVFLCHDDPDETALFLHSVCLPDSVRMIDLSGLFLDPADPDSPWVYALPELNRKPLVRGATKAAMPSAFATAALLGLLPLAKNLMLTADIHASVIVPGALAEPGEPLSLLDGAMTAEIAEVLRTVQTSFNRPIFAVMTAGGWTRGLSLVMYFKCAVAQDEITALYQDYYSDHGFTFISDSVPSLSEVVGTGKCIINPQKVDDRLVVSVVIDDTLKGSAAQAVHAMNLLFGLQERVGLMLHASR